MTCNQVKSDVIDLARGASVDSVRAAEVSRHVSTCPTCAALSDKERALSAALRRLAGTAVVPPPTDASERWLLAKFDAMNSANHTHGWRWMWPALSAAAIVCFAVGIWMLTGSTSNRLHETTPMASGAAEPALARPPSDERIASQSGEVTGSLRRRSRSISRQPSADPPTDFVPWPGAAARPPFESGELVRIDLPASVLPSLGLWSAAAPDAVVQADVVIGQDGYARAVRLAQ
jgi:hypothetical protein